MEQLSDSLYAGPLSLAAQTVLAALRGQNLHEARCNQNFSKHQQMERSNHSQRDLGALSRWNQVEKKDRDTYWPQVYSLSTHDHNSSREGQSSQTSASYQYSQKPDSSLSSQASPRSSTRWDFSLQRQTSQTVTYYQHSQSYPNGKCSEPPAPPSSQALSVSRHEVPEAEVSLSQKDKYSPSLQKAHRFAEHHAVLCKKMTRASFNHVNVLNEGDPDEMSFSTTEQPNSHAVPSYSTSSCPEIYKETDKPSVTQNEESGTYIIAASEIEDSAASGNRLKQHLSDPDEDTSTGTDEGDRLYHQSMSETIKTKQGHVSPSGFVTKDMGLTGSEIIERSHTEEPLVQMEHLHFSLGDNSDHNLQKISLMAVAVEVETENKTKACINRNTDNKTETGQLHSSDIQLRRRPCETEMYRGDTELPGTDAEAGQRREDREVLVVPTLNGEEMSKSGVLDGKQSLTPSLSQGCGTGQSAFRAPCRLGNQLHHDTVKSTNGISRRSKSSIVAIPANAASRQNVSPQDLTSSAAEEKLENKNQPTFQRQSHHLRTPSFLLKRKSDVFQRQHAKPPPKISRPKLHPKWEPPRPLQKRDMEGGKSELKTDGLTVSTLEYPALVQESKTKISLCETGTIFKLHKEPLKQLQQTEDSNMEEQCSETATNACRPTPFSKTRKRRKCSSDAATNWPESLHEGISTSELQSRSKTSSQPLALTSDARVKDSVKLNLEERMQMLEKAVQSKVLVLTMVFADGTTQLNQEQKLGSPVCGLLIMMMSDLCCSSPEDSLGPNDSLVYLKLEHIPPWAQQQKHHTQDLFTRDMFLRVLSRSELVVCYKAKDVLQTTLQFYRQDLSWKQVTGCQIHDPQVSGWLLDPADPSACYDDLLYKHCKRQPFTTHATGAQKVSHIISDLCWLYRLNMNLCSKLKSQGLWHLYSDMELNMIPVLAAMETHRIHVDKDALRRTSDLLGAKMKQLEQEAHQAAGQIFLVTSSTQLRTVLFEKLRLHERCENKKLPKTVNKQQSTSEAALHQLQDLHPLPKIILEYRQVHKIKSTFVDGILSCMKSKNYISSTWHQTSAVTGRISAKHPNFQALPRQPLQIRKKQYIQGKDEEVVTVHPRTMFIPEDGWTFVAADFCQVELRLLAHFSSDPELLHIFSNPQADVFTMLATRWKGVSENEVTSEDREHAKRIVYSVVYGAGRERLSGILGVSAEQASRFQDTFLQTYRAIQTFIQRTIQQSHKRGYVLSVMGRRRNLPNINSTDWGVRMQSERQAVNFVVQGSAADLCKTAMIRIFNLVSSSSFLSARLLAQLHDELLYEVEDSQVEQFAGLVRSTMESLQHIEHLGLHLKVPLKVAISSGKSWGSMSELNIPPTSPP
ncbi:DNA polymerase nu [Cololabis saira]|uniref:DNA polymerase nu n=1 Tax=Cololabis saira TaxID=129043 RepID=UPI002AD3E5E2|nr:DNA polymerase nu [Cololabis saira]